ncbi:hypothetical protein J3R30DRAFT_3427634 [Lentinula aciculospora]|uniref:Uncharacterized protein n=1 Tax=Lentinula aciculospora TaxID=153920 RepID=A0A9W9DY74_9AGAR|nr:hypothetical protein J3R30DRAFT_3427634 [Lentinula aciculospora]
MFPGLLLFFVLISLLIQVGCTDEPKDYSPLNNGQGKTPCQMKSDVESCSGSLEAQNTVLASNLPTPSQCTCTNVYFNVWSACLFSSGNANSTLSSNNWTYICQQQGIQMVTDQYNSLNSMDLPSWTFINLTSNTTFDIAEALNIANQNKTPTKWNNIQVIVPIVVGLVVSAVFVLGIFIWRTKKKGSPGILLRMQIASSRVFRNGFGTSRIRTANRDQEWVIDRPTEANGESTEMYSNVSSSSRRPTGHIRLSSTSSTNIDLIKPRETIWTLPGKNLWKNSQLARKIRRTLVLFPAPWRNAPVTVQSISAPRKFEIDASSDRTRTDSTLANFRRGGFRVSGTRTETTESALATSRLDEYWSILEQDEEEGSDSDLDLRETSANNEREHLITDDSNRFDLGEVMIISRSGDDFTVHSQSDSPTHRILPSPVQPLPPPPRTPIRERHGKFSRRTPPAPKYPAPVPSNQPPLRKASHKPSIESTLQPSAAVSLNDNIGQLQRSPQPRQLPLPPPPNAPLLASSRSPSQHNVSLSLALPLHVPQTQHQSPLGNFVSLPSGQNEDPHPPNLSTSPPQYTISHMRNQSTSTANTIPLPLMSSPPYRSLPLPEEICIARSDSPPPPPSDVSSPPYTVTELTTSQSERYHDDRGRDHGLPLILAPPSPPPLLHHHANNSHHRLMSLPSNLGSSDSQGPQFESGFLEGDSVSIVQSGLANHPGYPFQVTLSSPQTHYRNFSDENLALPMRHTRSPSEPFVDNRLLFPGAVRAAGYMSSSSVTTSRRDLRAETSYESFQSVLSDTESSDYRRI